MMTTFVQYGLNIFFGGLVSFLLRMRVHGLQYLQTSHKPIIIASNHQRRFDMFLLAVLPFSILRKYSPIYFMTAEHYYRKWWLRMFIKPLGAYPVASYGSTYDELFGSSISFLKNGHSILMYPEGKMVRRGEHVVAKPGVAYLAQHSGVHIIPLFIKGLQSITIKNIITRRVLVSLHFGKSIQISSKEKTVAFYRREAQAVLDIIYSLK